MHVLKYHCKPYSNPMNMDSTIASILVTVPITFATLLLLHLLLKRTSTSRRLPPGPLGLPLLGRLPFLPINLHRHFADVCNAYGPVSSFRIGTRLCVAIASPSAAMQILKEQDTVFASHAVPTVASIVTKGGLDILWAPYGPHWRFGRRMAMQELLNTRVIGSFQSLRRREVHRMIRRLQSRSGNAVDVHEAVSSTALDVILGMMWDDALKEGTGSISAMAKEAKEVMDGVVEVTGITNISDFISALAPLDLQGLQRRMKALSVRYDAVFDAIIEHKSKSSENRGDDQKGEPKDFLQLMLDLVDKKDPDMPLEVDHIKAICLDLITAAVDTTTGTVEWAMSELVRKPDIIAKVQEELDAVIGDGGILEESHLSKLPYLEVVVKEALRMYPPLPLMVPHTPSEDAVVDGYTIPKGSMIFLNAWAIQRDPKVWEQPHEFRPERFFEEKNKRDYNGKSYDYLPFGRGRRMCVGMNLGERMVMYLLGNLLHSLNWRIPNGAMDLDMEEKFLVVLKKKEPLMLVPLVRLAHYSQTCSDPAPSP